MTTPIGCRLALAVRLQAVWPVQQEVERLIRRVSKTSHGRTEGVPYPVSTTHGGDGVRVFGWLWH